MSEENTLTRAQVDERMIEDNRELLRIIASALYPAHIQRYFLRKARKEIRNMSMEDRESFAFKVQKEAIEWEKEYLSRNNF